MQGSVKMLLNHFGAADPFANFLDSADHLLSLISGTADPCPKLCNTFLLNTV
jgi:hypothetical protein